MLKKKELLIIAVLAAAAIIAAVCLYFLRPAGRVAVVSVNNAEYCRLPLNKNTTVKLTGNTVCVENGFVYMKSATCKNQICVHTPKASKVGDSIICLPHKVVIEVKNEH